MRDLAASAPFYEALLGFLGYTRVKQETALYVWDLVREGTILGGVALRAAHSARPHDHTSAGLNRLAFHAALLDAPADYPQRGASDAAVFMVDPDGLKLEVVPFPG